MNAEAERYVKACNQESLNLGSAAVRLHALRNLKLKTAIKVMTLLHLRRGQRVLERSCMRMPSLSQTCKYVITLVGDKLNSSSYTGKPLFARAPAAV